MYCAKHSMKHNGAWAKILCEIEKKEIVMGEYKELMEDKKLYASKGFIIGSIKATGKAVINGRTINLPDLQVKAYVKSAAGA